jgi:hypothetical protein
MAVAGMIDPTTGPGKAEKARCVAVVPVSGTPRRAVPIAGLTRPDPSFVTHLIAMAERSPQTRLLQRAAPTDVQSAYGSVARHNRRLTPAGIRVRQIA